MVKITESDKNLITELLKQQKELEQSIKYASYIQSALLPVETDLNLAINKNFVIFLPCDIVSGDFYWIYREKERTTIAVGDCTGHGVPGAFLSILGISFLNLVVSKHQPDNPASVLNFLREYIMKALNQTGEAEEQKDGIDIAVCMLKKGSNTLEYSGAFNTLYIIRDGNITRLNGDKMPVGVAAEYENSFTNIEFELKKNDTVYLFTDGYPDQFGGSNGKKLKYENFRNLLINASKLPIHDQKSFLINEFHKWKGGNAQLDDVTILGFRHNI